MTKRKRFWLEKQRKITNKQYKLLVKLLKNYSCLYCNGSCDDFCNDIINKLSNSNLSEKNQIKEFASQIKKREAECDNIEREDVLDDIIIS